MKINFATTKYWGERKTFKTKKYILEVNFHSANINPGTTEIIYAHQ